MPEEQDMGTNETEGGAANKKLIKKIRKFIKSQLKLFWGTRKWRKKLATSVVVEFLGPKASGKTALLLSFAKYCIEVKDATPHPSKGIGKQFEKLIALGDLPPTKEVGFDPKTQALSEDAEYNRLTIDNFDYLLIAHAAEDFHGKDNDAFDTDLIKSYFKQNKNRILVGVFNGFFLGKDVGFPWKAFQGMVSKLQDWEGEITPINMCIRYALNVIFHLQIDRIEDNEHKLIFNDLYGAAGNAQKGSLEKWLGTDEYFAGAVVDYNPKNDKQPFTWKPGKDWEKDKDKCHDFQNCIWVLETAIKHIVDEKSTYSSVLLGVSAYIENYIAVVTHSGLAKDMYGVEETHFRDFLSEVDADSKRCKSAILANSMDGIVTDNGTWFQVQNEICYEKISKIQELYRIIKKISKGMFSRWPFILKLIKIFLLIAIVVGLVFFILRDTLFSLFSTTGS